jgi:lactate dehydrogenase-like 2-hydroxyacid dehydrogenase
MTSKPHLLITNNFHTPTIQKLDLLFHIHRLWELDTRDQGKLITKLNGSCKAVASGSWDCNDLIYNLDSLEIIAAYGVGVDGIDLVRTKQNNIKVTNTPDVLNNDVADIALSLVLATTRNIVNADQYVRSGQWSSAQMAYGSGLAGRTLGIVGLGRIGEAVAERALPFKLNIAYHNRTKKTSEYTYFSSLLDLAKASDILVCILPGGEETRHLVNHQVLSALGPDGIFINIGRGSAVDEAALIDLLSRNAIAGAGLDVYSTEPNVPLELRKLKNAVLLPHIGSATMETRHEMGDLVIKNLVAFFSNQKLITEVS